MFEYKESVYRIDEFLENADEIGILVGKITDQQLHAGVIYRSEKNLNILHLAWHHDLKEEESIGNGFKNYFWVKPKIPIMRQHLLKARCKRIFENYSKNGFKYGLYYKNGTFTNDGTIKLDEAASGLTCATFVLAVFASEGYNLLKTNEWPSRPEDKLWHDEVVSILKDHGVEPEHIKNVISEKGCARFRPEEVSLSCAFTPIPADIASLIEQATCLKEIVISSN
ncbi:hypothetical protein [Labilibaculum euxinus]